jgi:Sec-independent protein translocase protein TatA
MKFINTLLLLAGLHASIILSCESFLSRSRMIRSIDPSLNHEDCNIRESTSFQSPRHGGIDLAITSSWPLPASFARQRRSVANVQMMGLFGLGGAEVAIILVIAAFVVGPQQISKMAGNMAGKVKGEYNGLPDELKKIPSEFQKGFEEGSVNAKSRNAKQMELIPSEDEDGTDSKK